MKLFSLYLLFPRAYCVPVDAVSESVDHLTADVDRRVHSGPKERTRHSSDSVQLGPSLTAEGRLVPALVSLCFDLTECS